jgi:hypothetical protein
MPDMFKIQEAHLKAFEASRLSRFERRATGRLRALFPDQTSQMSDEALGQRVRDGLDRASAYGLTTERHVMAFLATTFLAGERFDTEPNDWARSILTGRGLKGEDKADLLLIAATERAGTTTAPAKSKA